MNFSVIIPTFNRSNYLRVAIKSILRQRVPAYEVIVINDGSTDNTDEVCRDFGSQIRYFKKNNEGKAAALNVALAYATGDVIYVLDDDDIALPFAISRHKDALLGDPNAGFSYGPLLRGYQGKTDTLTIDRRAKKARFLPIECLYRQLEDTDLLHPCLAVRRKCFDVIGGFDETYFRCQDYEFMLRLMHKYKGVRTSRPIYINRVHSAVRGSASLSIQSEDIARISLHFDRKAALTILPHITDQTLVSDALSTQNAPAQAIRGLATLRRAVIKARKADWHGALTHVRQYLRYPETAVPDTAATDAYSSFFGSYRANRELYQALLPALLIPWLLARRGGQRFTLPCLKRIYWHMWTSYYNRRLFTSIGFAIYLSYIGLLHISVTR